jgi:hypothetical protein
MKLLRLILALCCAVPAFAQKEALQRAVGTNTVTGALASTPFQVSTIAALKATVVTNIANDTDVYVTCYSTAGDGGDGHFRYSSASSATDDGGTIIQPTAGTGRWLRVYEAGAYNVRWFGAKGDGSTDDTAAIQAAVTASLTPVSFIGRTLFIPAGNYKLTNEIAIPFSTSWKISGVNRGTTLLTQFTNNKAIFALGKNITHTWEISNLGLTWNTQQTTSDTMAYAIRFDHDPSLGAAETTFFNFKISQLSITKCYRGIGQSEAASTGPIPYWAFNITDITGGNSVKAFIFNVSPVANGSPNNHISNIYYGGWAGSPTSQKEPPIMVYYADAFFNNLDIEGCGDIPVMDLRQTSVAISGLHIENWNFTGAVAPVYTNTLIYAIQSEVTIDGASISCAYTVGAGVSTSLTRGFQSYFALRGFVNGATYTGTTNVFQFDGQETYYYLKDYMPGISRGQGNFSLERPSLGNLYFYSDAAPKFRGGAVYGGLTRYEFNFAGTTTLASGVITGIVSTAHLKAGDGILGYGLSPSTTIVSVDSGTQITVTPVASATGATTLSRTVNLSTNYTVYGATQYPSAAGIAGLVGLGKGENAFEGAIVMWRNAGIDRNGGAVRWAATGINPTTARLATSPTLNYGSEVFVDRYDIGTTGNQFYSGATAGPKQAWGTGTPEGVVTAPIGSTYQRTDGGALTSFYVKESGTGNTGWVGK